MSQLILPQLWHKTSQYIEQKSDVPVPDWAPVSCLLMEGILIPRRRKSKGTMPASTNEFQSQ